MWGNLFHLTDIKLFLIVGGIFIIISISGVFLVKHLLPVDFRYKENAVVGVTCALLSVIYAVLTGITALYLTNINSYTADAVQREANAVADLYRDSAWLPETTQKQIQSKLQNYLHQVIDVEWPQMKSGQKVSMQGDLILNAVAADLKNQLQPSPSELVMTREILNEIRTLYDARHQRINMSYSQLSPETWVVIFIGTVLMLFVNYLYGMNFYLHIYVVVVSALMLASMLFLLITLDRPFQGEFAIDSTPFQMLQPLFKAEG